MKKIVTIAILCIGNALFGQVGINTPEPKASLDIMAKNSTGTTTNPEGLLIPRIDRQKAQSMTGVETSTIIYVNNIATGTLAGTAINIDVIGYYYFNGTTWIKLNANIYNADGALTGPRTVTQGTNTLTFRGTAANAFSVGANTLSVDLRNNRVGIGTTTPENRFEVVSDNLGGTSGNNYYFKGFGNSKEPAIIFGSSNGTAAAPVNLVNGDQIGSIYFAPRANGSFLTSSGSSITSNYRGDGTTSLTDFAINTSGTRRMYVNESGDIGISTTAPAAKVDIIGKTFGIRNAVGSGSWDNLWFNVTPSIPSINASGAENGLQFNVGSNAVGTYGDGQTLTTVATMRANGNMGIGTTAPATRLDVQAVGITPAIKIVDGRQAEGNVLTSDANGLATWRPVSSANIYTSNGTLTENRIITQDANTLAFTGSAVNAFSVDGTTLSVDAANNRVGIGTTAPTAKIDITGDAITPPIKASNMEISNVTTLANKNTLSPVLIDGNGVMVKQFSPTSLSGGYAKDEQFNMSTTPTVMFDNVNGSLVLFKFLTNYAFSNSGTGFIYGQISFTVQRGFQIASDWSHTAQFASGQVTLEGVGTNTLTFKFSDNPRELIFTYDATARTVNVAMSAASGILYMYEGKKIR